MSDLSHSELAELARRAMSPDVLAARPTSGHWPSAAWLGEDFTESWALFIAACSPEIILSLIEQARAGARDTAIGAQLLAKFLERNGMVEFNGYVVGFTDDADLAVWTIATWNEREKAEAVFYGDDREAEAVAWLAAASPAEDVQ